MESHRARRFKLPPVEETQQQRRLRVLEEQKKRRLLRVDSSRNLDNFANLSLDDPSDEEDASVRQSIGTNNTGAKTKRSAKRKAEKVSKWANMAMYAEPLDFNMVPEDLHDAWVALAPIPRGKRCMLIAYKAFQTGSYVSLRSRVKGHQLMTFPTHLPDDTILDCILDENWQDNGILHILDIIRWKGQDFTDCEARFRLWWRDMRLAEISNFTLLNAPSDGPEIQKSAFPYKLLSIPTHVQPSQEHFLKTIIPLAYSGLTHEGQLLSASDGILLYLADGLYESGSSPLALWVSVTPLEEGGPVPLESLQRFLLQGSQGTAFAIDADMIPNVSI